MGMYDYANLDPDIDSFLPQTNGEISESITQNWTQQAFECYSVKCDCSKCSIIQENYSFVCQMPKIVKSLIKTQGIPKSTDFLFY